MDTARRAEIEHHIPPTPELLKRSVRVGLIGGAVAVYFMAVGMVGKFDPRQIIGGLVGLGFTLLIITVLATGYMAVRPRKREGPPPPPVAVLAGAVAGGVAGIVSAVVLVSVDAFGVEHVRRMFQSLNANLVNQILSFGRSVGFGAVVLVVAGAALGGLGAALQPLPRRLRRSILAGLLTLLVLAMAEPFVGQVFVQLRENFSLGVSRSWLYRRGGGLNLTGTIISLALGFGITWWRGRVASPGTVPRRPPGTEAERAGPAEEAGRREEAPPARAEPMGGIRSLADIMRGRVGKSVGWVLLLGVLVLLPQIVGPFLSQVIVTVGIYVLLGLGLNIVVGFAGLLDLGYVAFFAVGAYSVAVLTSPASAAAPEIAAGGTPAGLMNFWYALPLVVAISVIAGVLIGAPVLRLRGDYLAIVTLGFGEIARVLIASRWLEDFLGGAQGILRIPAPPPGAWSLRKPENLYYLVLILSLAAAFVSYRLKDSRVGRAWAAMREDEAVAEAMGVSVINYKLLAFAMGAGIGSLGGAIFSIQVGSVFPNSFDILVSINALSVIVLGGMGSIPGVVLGSFALVGLPELLREFEEFRLLIYGGVLVALMILKPEGLLPEVRRRRELHERELEEEQYEEEVGERGAAPVLEAGPEERRE